MLMVGGDDREVTKINEESIYSITGRRRAAMRRVNFIYHNCGSIITTLIKIHDMIAKWPVKQLTGGAKILVIYIAENTIIEITVFYVDSS